MKSLGLLLSVVLVLLILVGCAEKQPPVFKLIRLSQEGKYDEAIALAEKLIAKNPDDAEAHRFLVRAERAKNELDKAREKYEKEVEANPQTAGYHFGLGYILVQLGEYEKGIAEVQKALELNPSLEYAHFVLGWTYIMPNWSGTDPEKGLAEWKKEEERDPKSLGALQVYSDRADYSLRKGDIDTAEKDYEKITIYGFAPGDISSAREYITRIRTLRDELAKLEADVKDKPDDADVRLKLGVLQYKNGKIDDAIATWTKAAELAPDNVDVRNYLGKALLEKKDYAKAEEQFKKVLEVDGNMATAYYNLAVTEEYLGQPQAALANYKKYIELNPMAPKLDEVKQRISTLEGAAKPS